MTWTGSAFRWSPGSVLARVLNAGRRHRRSCATCPADGGTPPRRDRPARTAPRAPARPWVDRCARQSCRVLGDVPASDRHLGRDEALGRLVHHPARIPPPRGRSGKTPTSAPPGGDRAVASSPESLGRWSRGSRTVRRGSEGGPAVGVRAGVRRGSGVAAWPAAGRPPADRSAGSPEDGHAATALSADGCAAGALPAVG